jgi:hypothetical protein
MQGLHQELRFLPKDQWGQVQPEAAMQQVAVVQLVAAVQQMHWAVEEQQM